MYEILQAAQVAPDIWRMRVHAPRVAAKVRAGQFFLVKADEDAERLPFTFCDWDAEAGWIEFVFLCVGRGTRELAEYRAGDGLLSITGPLGRPTEVDAGRWAVAGGGVGLAAAYPVARALCEVGAQVTAIIGARNRELLVLEDKFRALPGCTVIPCTDDGSYGTSGFVSGPLTELCESKAIDHAFVVGPVPMMGVCAGLCSRLGTPVTVSLNPVMLDGTGMCGGCRVIVDGQVRFACVDGVDFDGALVDWDDLKRRVRTYAAEEAESLEHMHACRMRAAADALEAAGQGTDAPQAPGQSAVAMEAVGQETAGQGRAPADGDAGRPIAAPAADGSRAHGLIDGE